MSEFIVRLSFFLAGFATYWLYRRWKTCKLLCRVQDEIENDAELMAGLKKVRELKERLEDDEV